MSRIDENENTGRADYVMPVCRKARKMLSIKDPRPSCDEDTYEYEDTLQGREEIIIGLLSALDEKDKEIETLNDVIAEKGAVFQDNDRLQSALTSAQERIKELEEMIKDANDDKRFED